MLPGVALRYPRGMDRIFVPEHMDAPDADRDELDDALRLIRAVNRRLGGTGALIRHLKAWSARWPKDRPITMLDLGTGSADIPVAAVRWARSRGYELRVTGIDNHETTLDLAREYLEREGMTDAVTLVRQDALGLVDHFGVRSFDYTHAGMFLHHLPEIEVLTALRVMERLSRAGLVWNDLIRSRFAYAGIWLLTIGSSEMVRHDARVSVLKGFSRREVLGYARRLELQWCRHRSWPWVGRFTLAGERPGAWS